MGARAPRGNCAPSGFEFVPPEVPPVWPAALGSLGTPGNEKALCDRALAFSWVAMESVGIHLWRRRWDSNPRCRFCPHTPLAGEHLRPLGHVSLARWGGF